MQNLGSRGPEGNLNLKIFKKSSVPKSKENSAGSFPKCAGESQSWCWRGWGSSSWGVGGGSLVQPMVFIISTNLKLFSTSGAF